MKKIALMMGLAVVAVFAAASIAFAAVSSPCGARPAPAKPRPAPAPREAVDMSYRRDVLGQKIPIYTHHEGDALTDEATKYEETLMSGRK